MAHFAVPMAGGVLVTLNTRLSPAEIAHIIETGRRYLRAGSVDSLLTGEVQVSVLDSFKPYLHDRLAEGERNATLLLTEITGQGLNRRPQHPVQVPTTAAPSRRSHTRGPAATPGAACGAAGHRLDHRPPRPPRPGR